MENNSIPKEEIERLAYAIYLERGGEDGHALEHWLLAEEELQLEQAGRLEPVQLKSKSAGAGFGSTAKAERSLAND